MEQSINSKVYITKSGKVYNIKEMSKGFLKNQIVYLEKTNPQNSILNTLKQTLKEKSRLIFKFTK